MRRLFALLLALPCAAAAQDGAWENDLTLRLAEKYDDNLDLTALENAQAEQRADLVTEFGVSGRARRTSTTWDLDLGLRMRADLPISDPNRLRMYASPDVFVAWQLADAHALSVQLQGSCFNEPGDASERLDVCRNLATLAWRWAISDALVLRAGVEKQDAFYFNLEDLDYSSGGPFVEVRLPFSYRFSTWIRGSALFYHGALRLRGVAGGDLQDGERVTLETGVEWLPTRGVSLIATLQLQADDSESIIQQVGGPDFPDDALETDAQFNYRKARGSLLATWRINNRFTVGAYGELLRIGFFDSPGTEEREPDRIDVRWLTTTFVKARLNQSGLAARLRYLNRHNDSTAAAEAFGNHIVSIGLEQRW